MFCRTQSSRTAAVLRRLLLTAVMGMLTGCGQPEEPGHPSVPLPKTFGMVLAPSCYDILSIAHEARRVLLPLPGRPADRGHALAA